MPFVSVFAAFAAAFFSSASAFSASAFASASASAFSAASLIILHKITINELIFFLNFFFLKRPLLI
jgi:hypothetical protein